MRKVNWRENDSIKVKASNPRYSGWVFHLQKVAQLIYVGFVQFLDLIDSELAVHIPVA